MKKNRTKLLHLKNLLVLCLLMCISHVVHAQSMNIVVSPSVQCFTSPNPTTTAYVQPLMPGANNYSWVVTAPSATACTPIVTSFTSMNAGVFITHPCCGVYTITCFAYSGSVVIGSVAKTVTILCGTPVSITAMGGNVLCGSGSRTLVASGASSYTWSTGATGNAIVVSPSVSTCYSVVGSGTATCNNVASICLSVTSSPSITVSGPSSICYGNTGILSASGATSYTWLPGSITGPSIVISPSSSTCYTVIGSNGPGCTGSAVKCVSVNASSPFFIITGPNSLCAGNTAILSYSGAISNFTWMPGGMNTSSIAISPTATTCYTLFGSSSSGCTGAATKCVSITTSPVISLSGNFVVCNNTSPITAVASGATSYTWLPINTTGSVAVFNASTATCFTVIGSNGPGCTGATATCITIQQPTISVTGNSVICPGNTTTLTASGANSYTWSNGFPFASIAVSPTVTTCYTVSGTNSNGCTGTKVYCVAVMSNPTITTSAGLFCAGNPGTVCATGANSYTWLPFNQTGNCIVITPTSGGCYTVIGSNGPGCSNSAVGCYSVSPAPTITISGPSSPICAGGTTSLSATGASSVFWQPGNLNGNVIVVSPSVTTCYTATGYNGSCPGSAVRCVTVTPASLNVSGPNVVCAGQSATFVGSGALSYTWQPGNLTGSVVVVTPSVPTCYTVSGFTSGGCIASAVKCLSVSSQPNITIYGSNFCAGIADTLYASGASSYTWMPFNMTGSYIVITPTASTCFTVIGSNGSGCIGTAFNCFSVAPSPTVTVSGNTSICGGGSATLTASGASTYYWYPGNLFGSSIAVSPSVSTCYTVYGYNGSCYSTAVKCVSVQPNSLTITGNSNICAGNSTTLTASGSTSYTWIPGNLTGSSIVVTPTANTCYTVVASNGVCTSVGVKCVTVSSQPNVTITGSNTVCQNNWVFLLAGGATSYTWLPGGQTTPSIAPTVTANTCFTLIGSNGLGCTGSTVKCVSVTPSPTITVTGNTTICAGQSTTLVASGASSYSWMPGGQTSPVIVVSPTASTCYSILGYNSFGCMGVSGICINVQSQPNITISGNQNICQGGVLSFTASGATSYTWPGGATGNVYTLSPGFSTCIPVVGSNGPGCTGSAIRCFTVQPSPTISIASSPNSICAGNSATLTVFGAVTYSWSNGGSGSAIVVTPTANTCYSVAGTSTYGCVGTAVKCITVSPAPSVSIFGPGSICAGSTATLLGGGALNYTWLPGGSTSTNIVVSPASSTCYTLIGSFGSGCTSTAVKCLTVVPYASITVNGNTNLCAGQSTTLTLSGASTYTWYPSTVSGSVVVLTPTATTCFSIIGTTSTGCSSYGGLCVNVSQAPTVGIFGNNSICSGSSLTFSGSGASSYTWLPGGSTATNIVVSPSVSTCYTLIGSNGPGCTGSAVKCLTVNPSPVVTISGNNFICSGNSANLLASGAVTYTWNTGSNSPLITVSPVSNVCYTVAGTSAQGCTGMATKCITVQAAPVLSVNNATICRGQSAFLVVTGASSYTWVTGANTPSILVSPMNNDTYTVVGSNGACSGTAAAFVTVIPTPTVVAFATPSAICAGQSATLNAGGAISYTWNTGATTTNIVVSPTVSTSYTVAGSYNNCTGYAATMVFVSPCTGIAEAQASGQIQFMVYPNPNNGNFNVAISSPGDNTVLEVYNTIGQLILTQKITSEVSAISLQNEAKGLYYIKVTQGDRHSFVRTIKD